MPVWFRPHHGHGAGEKVRTWAMIRILACLILARRLRKRHRALAQRQLADKSPYLIRD